jgi:Spy/CpxP family protein refolding chaperone
MRRIVTAVLLLAGLLGPGTPMIRTQIASAEEEGGWPGMMGHQMMPEMMQGMRPHGAWFYGRGGHEGPLISLMLQWKDQLGLTADQERSLRELRANYEKEAVTRTSEIDVAELELKWMLEQDKADLTKVEAQVRKIALLRADRRTARIKTIEAGKAVLTPEQAEKFKRLAHEPWKGGTGMMGPWMRPSPPSR